MADLPLLQLLLFLLPPKLMLLFLNWTHSTDILVRASWKLSLNHGSTALFFSSPIFVCLLALQPSFYPVNLKTQWLNLQHKLPLNKNLHQTTIRTPPSGYSFLLLSHQSIFKPISRSLSSGRMQRGSLEGWFLSPDVFGREVAEQVSSPPQTWNHKIIAEGKHAKWSQTRIWTQDLLTAGQKSYQLHHLAAPVATPFRVKQWN